MEETESAALNAFIARRALAASALVRSELRRATVRNAPDRLPQAEKVLAQLLLLGVSREVLDAAARLPPAGLRSLDAVHIASALELGDEMGPFVTYDARQAGAARAAGLDVVAPD